MDVNLFLFDGFETLDAFGPVEVLGRVEKYSIKYFSLTGGMVRSAQGAGVMTQPLHGALPGAIFVIPGGRGTRSLVQDGEGLAQVYRQAEASRWCLCVCTGSAVLAKSGALNGKRATSNKKAMAWVKTTAAKVLWAERARWCVDGKFYTASGVSAGMDMALGFVADRFGAETAQAIAQDMEYIWNANADEDPFA